MDDDGWYIYRGTFWFLKNVDLKENYVRVPEIVFDSCNILVDETQIMFVHNGSTNHAWH